MQKSHCHDIIDYNLTHKMTSKSNFHSCYSLNHNLQNKYTQKLDYTHLIGILDSPIHKLLIQVGLYLGYSSALQSRLQFFVLLSLLKNY